MCTFDFDWYLRVYPKTISICNMWPYRLMVFNSILICSNTVNHIKGPNQHAPARLKDNKAIVAVSQSTFGTNFAWQVMIMGLREACKGSQYANDFSLQRCTVDATVKHNYIKISFNIIFMKQQRSKINIKNSRDNHNSKYVTCIYFMY